MNGYGWINFNSANGGPVTVNSTTGAYDGYAWVEHMGWIHFHNSSPAYGVKLQDADLSVTKTAGTSPVTPGDTLNFTLTHACEDYEDGALLISLPDSGPLEGSAGSEEVFSISCMDTDGRTATKLVTVDKVE